jgi:hypothetical protein
MVRLDYAGESTARRALAAEASLPERLAHPLPVRSFGADPDAERPHLVMELVEGRGCLL